MKKIKQSPMKNLVPIPSLLIDSKFLQYLTEECAEVVSNCSTVTEQ